MARMHPQTLGNDVSIAERKVFHALAEQLPDTFTVLHGRRVVVPSEGRKPAIESEADFLVIDETRGFVVLEVKGGSDIGADEHGWYSIDSRCHRKPIKEPAAQAQRVMHTLLAHLHRQRGCPLHAHERRMGWGVVFPDFEIEHELDPGLPRPMLLDRKDLADLAGSIERLFAAHDVDRRPWNPVAASFVTEALSPCFLLLRPLHVRIEHQEPALVAMTDEQVRVLEACFHHPRLSVRGVAGSGKTFVAMELARRAASEGKRTLLVCFNVPLARHLQSTARGFAVRTFHALVAEVAEQAFGKDAVPETKAKDYYEHEAPALLLRALQQLPGERYDVVVVDEGQDFRAPWWPAIESLLVDRARSSLYVFFDPDQDLYGGGPLTDDAAFQLRLDYNCRNTRRIGSYAARFASQMPKFRPTAPDGDEVVLVDCDGAETAATAVGLWLDRLVANGGIATDRIVVLSPLSRDRSPVAQKGRLGRFELVELDTAVVAADQVRFSTVHRFKGLESDVVVLFDVAPGEDWSRKALVHVGASRAKHFLAVVGTGLGDGGPLAVPPLRQPPAS